MVAVGARQHRDERDRTGDEAEHEPSRRGSALAHREEPAPESERGSGHEPDGEDHRVRVDDRLPPGKTFGLSKEEEAPKGPLHVRSSDQTKRASE